MQSKPKNTQQIIRTLKLFLENPLTLWILGSFAVILALIFCIPVLIHNCNQDNATFLTQIPTITENTTLSLPTIDKTDIWKTNIDNNLVETLYEKANSLATSTMQDARLSRFDFMVTPYLSNSKIRIYFYFYSELLDKELTYVVDDRLALYLKNDISGSDIEIKTTFTTLPWMITPDWFSLVEKPQEEISTLSDDSNTGYLIVAYTSQEPLWKLRIMEGMTQTFCEYTWDVKGNLLSSHGFYPLEWLN